MRRRLMVIPVSDNVVVSDLQRGEVGILGWYDPQDTLALVTNSLRQNGMRIESRRVFYRHADARFEELLHADGRLFSVKPLSTAFQWRLESEWTAQLVCSDSAAIH